MRARTTLAQGKTVKSVMMRIDVALANLIRARARKEGKTVTEVTRFLASILEKGGK